MPGPNGQVMHAEIEIGDSIVMLADEHPQMGARSPQTIGGTACSLHVYVRRRRHDGAKRGGRRR